MVRENTILARSLFKIQCVYQDNCHCHLLRASIFKCSIPSNDHAILSNSTNFACWWISSI